MENEIMGVEYCLDGSRAWSRNDLLLHGGAQKSDWQTKARPAIKVQPRPCDCATVCPWWRRKPATTVEHVDLFYRLQAAERFEAE